MHHPHAWRCLAIAASATLLSGAAVAQSSSYYYFGLGLGQSTVRFDQTRIANRMLNSGQTLSSLTADDSSSAYRVFGGYQFNPWLGTELGYTKLGNFGFQSATTTGGRLDGDYRVKGVSLDLVATMPVSEQVALLARVGGLWARTRADFYGSGGVTVANASASRRATNVKVGVGMQYAVSSSLLLRAEAERYRVNDAIGERGNVNVLSLSLVVPFGRGEAARPRAAMAPMPVAQPMPAPVVAPPPVVVAAVPAPPPPAPVPAPSRRVSYAAESLFGFDKSNVREEGQRHLDTFAGELAGARFDKITVEGHTDRLGSEAYNQPLSLARADAVKSYLVTNGKIDPSKISAVGMGESAPMTKPGDCVGQVANAKLVACLQPDRRVVIEVVGSR